MSSKAIRVIGTVQDDVLHVDLVSPERRNAIDDGFTDDLLGALEPIGSVRAVLLTSSGEDFCVGGDVRAFAAADEPSAFVGDLASSLHRAVRKLSESPAVVIAAVRGWATGAGMSLALAADICIASETARFRAAYPAIGLSPDGGLSWTLPRALGRSAALYAILSNRVISAPELHTMGLIAEVCPDEDLDRQAEETARQIAAITPEAVAATKALVGAAQTRLFTAHLDEEAAAIARCAATASSRALVHRFVARR